MSRWFMNLPAMPDVDAVESVAEQLGALRVGGYAAIDGLRTNVEIDRDVAEMLGRAAVEVELRGCALEAIAEGMR